MDAETLRWVTGIAGTLLSVIGGFIWWDIRRLGKNVHGLRTEMGTIFLRLESEVRQGQRDIAEIHGRMEEASGWRDMVLELIRSRD